MDLSPDGSSLLIGTTEEGRTTDPQWIVPVLGGTAKRLEDGEGEAFSPDGASVIFSTANGEIFTVQTDGTAKRKLATVGSVAFGFKWSPDGKVIRFSKDDALWEISSDGTAIHRLLPGWRPGVFQCCGRWAQDGSLFVFWAGNPQNGQLWALDERRSLFRKPSSLPVQLTSGPTAWGPPVPGKAGNNVLAWESELVDRGFSPL